MKQVGKIVGMVLALSLGVGTWSVFCMEQAPDLETEQKAAEYDDNDLYGPNVGGDQQDCNNFNLQALGIGGFNLQEPDNECDDSSDPIVSSGFKCPCPSLADLKALPSTLKAIPSKFTSKLPSVNDVTYTVSIKSAEFRMWVAGVQRTKACGWLSRIVGTTVALHLLNFVWTGASVYCATGDVNALSAWTVCPAVTQLDWVYGGVAAFLVPHLTWLTDSALEYQKMLAETWEKGEFLRKDLDGNL